MKEIRIYSVVLISEGIFNMSVELVERMMRFCVLLFALSLLAACSTTVYKDEATRLASAGAAIGTSIPNRKLLTDAASSAVGDFAIRMILLGGPVQYSLDCEKNGYDLLTKYDDAAVSGDQHVRDKIFAQFAQLKPCTNLSEAEVSPDASKIGAEKKQTWADDSPTIPKTKAEKAVQKKAEVELKQAEMTAVAAASSGTPAGPKCATKSCTLEDYTAAISAYAGSLRAIVSGATVKDVQSGLNSADKSAKALVSAAGLPAIASPVADAIKAIANLAIQDAQYEALKSAVLTFDSGWKKAAPAVENAARVRYALLLYYRTAASLDAAKTAQIALNDPSYYSSRAERVLFYEDLNPRVTAAAAALSTAERVDPAVAFRAFGTANHALALAILDPDRQMLALKDALTTLESQATALKKAVAAKPTKKSSGG